MARKDFDIYYRKIANQYFGLNETLKEMSKEVENELIDPSRLEQLKATILPVKNSYETLNYIRYLLDMPNKKSKKEAYKGRAKKVLAQSGNRSGDKILQNNKNIIDSVKDYKIV